MTAASIDDDETLPEKTKISTETEPEPHSLQDVHESMTTTGKYITLIENNSSPIIQAQRFQFTQT